jgi:fatty acid desaturase
MTNEATSVRRPAVEWPTLALAAVIYGGFLAVTWFHAALPWWLTIALGAWFGAWQASLQHEIVHGHPTRWRRLNHALARPSLVLWLPFDLYRRSHLAHHVDSRLTDPLEDPESFYVTPGAWAAMGRTRRGLLWMLNTLAGRLVVGPARTMLATLRTEAVQLARGDARRWRDWPWHGLALAGIGAWAFGVCDMPVWEYVLGFAYGGTSLMLLRSFLEHQATEAVPERTVVVDAEAPFRLLFLNNNLHAVHHDRPRVPWYRLPARYRAARDAYLARNGGYHYPGYAAIALRYLFRAKEPPVHPLSDGARVAAPATAATPAPETAEAAPAETPEPAPARAA